MVIRSSSFRIPAPSLLYDIRDLRSPLVLDPAPGNFINVRRRGVHETLTCDMVLYIVPSSCVSITHTFIIVPCWRRYIASGDTNARRLTFGVLQLCTRVSPPARAPLVPQVSTYSLRIFALRLSRSETNPLSVSIVTLVRPVVRMAPTRHSPVLRSRHRLVSILSSFPGIWHSNYWPGHP